MSDTALPDLLVIGAMKCGTSSLHHYLGLHPRVGMSQRKELNFFLPQQPTTLPGGEDELPLLREETTHDRGLDWYEKQFPGTELRGESSVAYSLPWFPEAAELIATALPGVKLIYLVRHPLERMQSHLAQFRGRDGRSPAEAFTAPGNPYLAASRYATALEPFLEHFARDHLQIVDADHLRQRRSQTMASIFTFLGVEPELDSREFARERNRTAAKNPAYRAAERLRAGPLSGLAERLPRGLRAGAERLLGASTEDPQRAAVEAGPARQILDALEPDTDALEALTGWDLSSWRRISSSIQR